MFNRLLFICFFDGFLHSEWHGMDLASPSLSAICSTCWQIHLNHLNILRFVVQPSARAHPRCMLFYFRFCIRIRIRDEILTCLCLRSGRKTERERESNVKAKAKTSECRYIGL